MFGFIYNQSSGLPAGVTHQELDELDKGIMKIASDTEIKKIADDTEIINAETVKIMFGECPDPNNLLQHYLDSTCTLKRWHANKFSLYKNGYVVAHCYSASMLMALLEGLKLFPQDWVPQEASIKG